MYNLPGFPDLPRFTLGKSAVAELTRLRDRGDVTTAVG